MIAAIVGVIVYLEKQNPNRTAVPDGQDNLATLASADKAKQYEPAKELVSPDGYLNTDRITLGSLVGKKVVLLDFWTYSCINCQRTIPYLNAWYQKYKDQGLEIIGVHTPEFEFEKNRDNVAAAVKKFGIKYPVVQDNEYATWNTYGNRYWPHEYLIDIDGYIVHDHIGEGGYAETEQEIQQLLQERMTVLDQQGQVSHDMVQPADAVSFDAHQVGSQETYFGAARNDFLGNGRRYSVGAQTLAVSGNLSANTLYLDGTWNFQNEFAQNQTAGARVIFGYLAKNVYLVASAAAPVQVEVYVDGKILQSITIQTDQLYQLVSGSDYATHTLELRVQNPGLHAYTLTFG